MTAQFPYSLPQVIIPAGQAVSNAVLIGSGVIVGIIIPAAWTAAQLTFLVSLDGVNYYQMVDSTGTNVVSVNTPTINTFVAVAHFELFRGAIYIQLQSGTTAAQVNQTLAAQITLVIDKSVMGGF